VCAEGKEPDVKNDNHAQEIDREDVSILARCSTVREYFKNVIDADPFVFLLQDKPYLEYWSTSSII
jgi:hypothetical protein